MLISMFIYPHAFILDVNFTSCSPALTSEDFKSIFGIILTHCKTIFVLHLYEEPGVRFFGPLYS